MIIEIHECKRNTWHCQGLKIVAEFRQTINACVMWKHRTPGKNQPQAIFHFKGENTLYYDSTNECCLNIFANCRIFHDNKDHQVLKMQ